MQKVYSLEYVDLSNNDIDDVSMIVCVRVCMDVISSVQIKFTYTHLLIISPYRHLKSAILLVWTVWKSCT